jgi:hypothetical protein
MTKQQFIEHFKAMYRVGNRSDAAEHEDWTQPQMAGDACCRLLDKMGNELVKCGALTQDELDKIYSDL